MNLPKNSLQIDTYPWGAETIIWGFDSSHQYTFKILQPKKGRTGCLSLQYHLQKSESWYVVDGTVWALVVVDGVVCTRIMKAGDIQNLGSGVIHRLMGVSESSKVLEPSTPDAHAADKSVVKDVVRLHCMQGRAVVSPRTEEEAQIVKKAIQITEEACAVIEKGEMPQEYNLERIMGVSGFSI